MKVSTHPLVTFKIGDRDFAFDVRDVVEMVTARPPTPVPGACSRLVGVTSWRGKTLPVLELPGALKREAAPSDGKKRLLVLRRPTPFALQVDESGRIADPRDLEDLAVEGGEIEGDARESGVRLVRWHGRLLRVLDPVRVLGHDPLVRTCGPREDPA
jgi:chemotaxis signal transduction protein